MNKISQGRLIIYIVASIDVVLVIVMVLLAVVKFSRTAYADILVVPTDAKVLLNGREYSGGTFKIAPGKYDIEISKEGMNEKKFSIEINKNEVARIHTYLTGENGSFDYYIDNANEMLRLEDVSDDGSEEFVKEYNLQLSLLEKMPIAFNEKDIDGKKRRFVVDRNRDNDCKKIGCLRITDITGENEEYAKDYLVKMGFIMEYYDIEYEAY